MIRSLLVSITALFLFCVFMGTQKVQADDYNAVSIAEIDYETLEMKIDKGNNPIVYYSVDNKKTWNEVGGEIISDKYVMMDIAWASPASAVTIYLKGNEEKTVLKVTLPKQNTTFKVKHDKVSDILEFYNYEDSPYFWWRKSTDYTWNQVYFTNTAALNELIKSYRFKGTKLVFKLGQVKGTSATSAGSRPSKEITVSISKYANAPSVNLNVTKLVFNTKTTMEYKLANDAYWTPCTKNMTLDDVVPAFFNGATGQETIIYFRNAATDKKPVSLTTVYKVPTRSPAPSVGDTTSDVATKLVSDGKTSSYNITFMSASKEMPMEYCVIKLEDDFDEATAKWKSVTSSKSVVLSEKSNPAGTTLYFRFKGTAPNVSKKIDLVLPSRYSSFMLTY